jgi:hypothetical protein
MAHGFKTLINAEVGNGEVQLMKASAIVILNAGTTDEVELRPTVWYWLELRSNVVVELPNCRSLAEATSAYTAKVAEISSAQQALETRKPTV